MNTPNDSTVISARGVRKAFGKSEALGGVDLEVRRGECVGLLGPNGAGKSTFIGILYGAVERSGGELGVFDLDPRKSSRDIKRRIGVVPQENALDEGLTVAENLGVFARFVNLAPEKRDARILELLSYMSLDHKREAPIRSLSGGMKRRLAFVRALLNEPELLILDEPTTGLDPAVRHLLWQKVTDFKKNGKTILVTTHYMHEAEVLCDRVVVLNQGRIVDEGSPTALIAKHAPGFVALFGSTEGLEAQLRAKCPPSWVIYKQRDAWCVRATSLTELVEFQSRESLAALQLRPANLEDVYLKLTGEDLNQND